MKNVSNLDNNFRPVILPDGFGERAAKSWPRTGSWSGTRSTSATFLHSGSGHESYRSGSAQAPIWMYIDRQIHRLLSGHIDYVDERAVSIDPDAALHLRSALKKVCASSSVYPFISSDGEGGVAATWRADGRVIQIVADKDGESWSAVRRSVSETPVVSEITEPPEDVLARLREDIAELTRRVRASNPTWQDIFNGDK